MQPLFNPHTLEIDADAVEALALSRAKAEHAKCLAIGWVRPFADIYGHARTIAWTLAQTALDNEIALRERAKLPAAEQWARTAELAAEMAESAIPPRPAEAARFRAEAAALRRSALHLVAAE